MPMHTIPQNVTSYEDKIVGMFVGRQFIYLAVGGLTAFILISTGGGAAVIIRFILAIGAVGFGAAMALVKIYDRGFDSWVFAYLKAILGPTEWSWQKHEPLMELLVAPDKALTPTQKTNVKNVDPERAFNQMRKEELKSFVAGSSKDLDEDEQKFLSSLNFSEPMPRGTVSLAHTAAPPMLTPSHPTPAARPIARPAVTAPTARPLTPLARSTTGPSYTFEVNGKPQEVTLLNNQRTNRTMSRSLLYGGPLPVPVRGELRLNMDSSFHQELTNLIGFAPAGGPEPAFAAAPAPVPATATDSNAAALIINAPINQNLGQPDAASENEMNIKLEAAADFRTNAAMGARHKLQIEKSDETVRNTSPAFPSDDSVTLSPVDNTAQSSQPMIPPSPTTPIDPSVENVPHEDRLTVAQPIADQPTESPQSSELPQELPTVATKSEEDRLREQLATFEDLARRAQTQLEEERRNREKLEQEMQQQEQAAALQTQHYQDELQRLQQRSADAADQGAKAEQDLAAMQAQAQTNPASVNPQEVAQQAALVDKLKQEQERSAAFARELVQKLQQTPTIMPAPVAPATPEPTQPLVPASTSQPVAPAMSVDQLPKLSNDPNVINGFVFGPDGQFVEGAVVVIKDESGEAKRALKSNKLGQFVVTTSLSNGHYVVEADKKGLNLAILNVELTGQPVPALIIQATPTA